MGLAPIMLAIILAFSAGTLHKKHGQPVVWISFLCLSVCLIGLGWWVTVGTDIHPKTLTPIPGYLIALGTSYLSAKIQGDTKYGAGFLSLITACMTHAFVLTAMRNLSDRI